MMMRLVVAQVWRMRWFLLILLVSGAAGVPRDAESAVFTRLAMGYPLVQALTAIMILGAFWSRDVRVLPIARRTALRSAWLAALVLPVVIVVGRVLAVLTQLAVGATVIFGYEAIALAAVWDATYIGMLLTLMQRSDKPWQGLRQAFGDLRESAKALVALVWMLGLPFASPELLPMSFAEVTWLHIAGVIAGVTITAWPLVTAPDQWPTLGILHDAPRTTSKPTRPERAPRTLDKLTGMRRLLPGPVGTAALVAALTLAAGTALTFAVRGVQSPFGAGIKDVEFFLIGGPFFLLILSPFGWANGVTPYLRPLRALPVSAVKLVVTMTMVPLMMPVIFWILATGVHLVVGAPGDTSWRLGSFVLLCGVTAFSGAVHARFNSVLVLLAGAILPLFGLIALLEFVDKTAVEPLVVFWFPLIGVVGVPAAFLLNYLTISRGSSASPVYRSVPGASLYRGGQS